MFKTRKILLSFVSLLFVVLTAGCQSSSGTTEQTTTTEDNTPTELTTEYTDNFQLTQDYEGKDFVTDGIGEVTLNKCVDGDTAYFVDNGQHIKVRFLGVDTPESTAKLDPWGKAASHFTCEKLTNAHTIVLQREDEVMDSTGTRYLGFVWYDGRLLNLELVEEAFTSTKGLSGSPYADTFYKAELKTQKTGRRFWGEKDPDYDYSNTATQVTIKELRENQDDYLGKNVMLSGVITRVLAGNTYCAFIEQDGYGAYIFAGYTPIYKLSEGNEVRITANVSQYNGLLELSNIKSTKVEVITRENEVTPNVITQGDITEDLESTFVQLNNLTVTDTYESDSGSFSVYADDANGNEVELRVDGKIYPKIEKSLFTTGRNFDIIGNIEEFTPGDTTGYQIAVSHLEDITFND
jgi:micrococcal nuclease